MLTRGALGLLLLSLVLTSPLAAQSTRRPPRRSARQAAPQEVPQAAPAPVQPPPEVAVTPRERVDAGVAAYEEADFDAALQAFERAEAAGLDRALLVRVLAHRVLIAQATSDAAALETQALRLVTLEPDALRSEASPALVRALEHARSRAEGVVRVRIEGGVVGDHVEVRARVEGDVAGLVREVRLRAGRSASTLVQGESGVVRLEGQTTDDIVLVAECIGPGDAIVAHEGTPSAPIALSAATSTATAQRLLEAPPPAQDDTGLHVGLVLGGAAVVIAAVVVGVLVVDANAPRSQLSGPVVEW